MHKPKQQKAKSQAIPKIPNFTRSSDWDSCITLSGYDSHIPNLSGNLCEKVVRQLLLPLVVEPIFIILQTVKKHYSQAVNYRKYRLAS